MGFEVMEMYSVAAICNANGLDKEPLQVCVTALAGVGTFVLNCCQNAVCNFNLLRFD